MNRTDYIASMDNKPATEIEEMFCVLGWAGDYTAPPASQHKTIGMAINNTSGEITYMQPDSVLDAAHIKAIEFIDSTTLSQNPQVQDPATGDLYGGTPAAELARVCFVLKDRTREIAWIPGVTANRRVNNGKHCLVNVKGISWQDCYIILTGATLSLPAVTIRVWFD